MATDLERAVRNGSTLQWFDESSGRWLTPRDRETMLRILREDPARHYRLKPDASGVREDSMADLHYSDSKGISEAQARPLRDALRTVQEMWDELHRRGLNPQLMRRYSDAISVLERDFTARLPGTAGVGDKKC